MAVWQTCRRLRAIIAVAIICLRPMIVFENKGLPAKVGGSNKKKVKQKWIVIGSQLKSPESELPSGMAEFRTTNFVPLH